MLSKTTKQMYKNAKQISIEMLANILSKIFAKCDKYLGKFLFTKCSKCLDKF